MENLSFRLNLRPAKPVIFILLAAPFVIQCNHSQAPASGTSGSKTALIANPTQSFPDSWSTAISTPDPNSPALLGSGSMGAHFGPYGDATGLSGNSALLFLASSYDQQERILPIKNPMVVKLTLDGKEPDLSKNYSQRLDYKTGTLTTQWDQSGQKGLLHILVTTYMRGAAEVVTWQIQNQGPSSVQAQWTPASVPVPKLPQLQWLTDAHFLCGLGKEALHPTTPGSPITSQILPHQAELFTYAVFLPIMFAKGLIGKNVHPAPSQFSQSQTQAQIENELSPTPASDLPDIEITSKDPMDTVLTRSFIYNLRNAETDPPSPFGLSNTLYNGHVFWDADIWMAPALDFLAPDRVTQLCEYRLARLGVDPKQPWPWESATTGKNVSPLMDREIHIVGDVLWQLRQAQILGLNSTHSLSHPLAACQAFWKGQLSPMANGELGIKNVVSPDESHTGNNDLYTNLLAQWTLNGMKWVDNPDPKIHLPHDHQSYLTYDGDPVRGYKQAAAILSLWPLQYPGALKESSIMLKRFGDKTTPNGPAMSKSILALLQARRGDADNAYRIWKASWEPYLSSSFLQFNEKPLTSGSAALRSRNNFMTGAAGCLDAVIYGFAGFKIAPVPDPNAAAKFPLKDGYWLSITPHMPLAWTEIQFHHIKILGKAYTVTIHNQGLGTNPSHPTVEVQNN